MSCGSATVYSYQMSALLIGLPKRMKKRLARKPNNSVRGAGVVVSNPCCVPSHTTLSSSDILLFVSIHFHSSRSLSLSSAVPVSHFPLPQCPLWFRHPFLPHLLSSISLAVTSYFFSSLSLSLFLSHMFSGTLSLSYIPHALNPRTLECRDGIAFVSLLP